MFVIGGGAKLVTGRFGKTATGGGGFVTVCGVVPFKACNTGNVRSRLFRNITRAWSVGGSIMNVFVPTVKENDCGAPFTDGVTKLAGLDVIGPTAP